jgi:hypothetical protein
MFEVLNDDYWIDVHGVLLLDSVCPSTWKLPAALHDPHIPSPVHAACLSSQILVMNMMKYSALMAEQWQPPQWQRTLSNPGQLDCCCAGVSMPSEAIAMSSRRGPLVVLVRCLGRLSPDDKAAARVDSSRKCETLGWEHARPGLVSSTLQCSANHFNLFTKDYVSTCV